MEVNWFEFVKINIIPIICISLSVGGVIFLIGRQITLWYFKINRIESLLESIDSKLGEVISNKTDEKPAIIAAMAEGIEPEVCSTTDGSNREVEHDKFEDIQNIGTPEAEELKKDEIESFLEKVTNVLTKEYYISDLFSSDKKEKRKE